MRQEPFQAARSPDWEVYRAVLARLETGARRGAPPVPGLGRFPELYRHLCADYALARARRYSPGLIDELHDLVRRGYRQIHRGRPGVLGRALSFLAEGFPSTLRRHAALFWLAAVLFAVPALAMGIACYQDAELIYSIMDTGQVADLESSYDPSNRTPGRSAERQADSDFQMFGFYVWNNVAIGFRIFASGLLLGLGSAFFLIFNGLFIGAAAGHLTRLDFGSTFWTFVSGHAPYELTAMAISGAAGLLLGKALIAPGRRTRLAALRANAREAVTLAGGAALMDLLAAVLEAFWSGGGAPSGVKYGVGVLGWVLVALYLGLAGRGAGRSAAIGNHHGA